MAAHGGALNEADARKIKICAKIIVDRSNWAYDDRHLANFDYFEEGAEALRALPGVESVGITSDLPLADDQRLLARARTVRFTIDDRPAPRIGSEPVTSLSVIAGAYHTSMEIDLLKGRAFLATDDARSAPVVIISEAFAGRHFVPLSQEPSNGLTFVIKTATDPAALAPAVREALWGVDPTQAIWANRPVTDMLSDWVRQRRFNTALLTAFAMLALVLATIGVYGLVAFSVEERMTEFGVRRALPLSMYDRLIGRACL